MTLAGNTKNIGLRREAGELGGSWRGGRDRPSSADGGSEGGYGRPACKGG